MDGSARTNRAVYLLSGPIAIHNEHHHYTSNLLLAQKPLEYFSSENRLEGLTQLAPGKR
jgi:hypothetical protein